MGRIASDISGVYLIEHWWGAHLEPTRNSSGASSDFSDWMRTAIRAKHGETSPLRIVASSDEGALGRGSLRCVTGKAVAMVTDCRPDRSTFGKTVAFEMVADRSRTLVVPDGVAIGWQALSSGTRMEVGYSAGSQWCLDPHDEELIDLWPVAPICMPINDLAITNLDEIEAGDYRRERFTEESLKPVGMQVEEPVFRENRSHGAGNRGLANAGSSLRTESKGGYTEAKNSHSKRPTILVVGSTGQLGHDLYRQLRSIGTVIGACRRPRRDGAVPVGTQVDVARPASIREAIRRTQPQLIVNATGLTGLERCQSESRRAQAINARAPAIMAEEAKKIGAAMIHFCTDKVFDGQGERPFRENDTPRPLNQYGLTKLRGTQAVMGADIGHMVIRTGWLYSTHGSNYVQSLVDLITYRRSLRMANDYFGTPTSTHWIASTLSDLLSSARGDLNGWFEQWGGLYNMAMLGYASRLEVADHIVASCKQFSVPVVLEKLHSASVEELSPNVPCSKNCRLDATRFTSRFEVQLPTWREELNRQLAAMLGLNESRLLSIA